MRFLFVCSPNEDGRGAEPSTCVVIGRSRQVIAVEESAAAVKDAAINTLGIANLEFREGKAEDILGELGGSADVVVLDPPRAGCQPPVLDAVVRWAPRRVCYVSCDPESLARDLQVLMSTCRCW